MSFGNVHISSVNTKCCYIGISMFPLCLAYKLQMYSLNVVAFPAFFSCLSNADNDIVSRKQNCLLLAVFFFSPSLSGNTAKL